MTLDPFFPSLLRRLRAALLQRMRPAAPGACLVLLLLAAWPGASHAGYYQWDPVTLPLESGAACGNGTPYTFFVNRAWRGKDTVFVLEGGGACWGQKGCEGNGDLPSVNADGVGRDYFRTVSGAAFGLVTPFISRLSVLERVRTQRWNMVYLPYCTGDVHTGNLVRTYGDADPDNPRVQHHRGAANVRAAARWVGQGLRTRHLLVTGFSAGAVGATAGYPLIRDALAPYGFASLLADSGPLFTAPAGADPADYPSAAMHARVREAWGLDVPDDGLLPSTWAGQPGFSAGDLGSIPVALALRYPSDRFAYMAFQADRVFPAFSYRSFDPAWSATADAAERERLLQTHWQRDLQNWQQTLAPYGNVSWHLPHFRDFAGSHCLSIVDFTGTGIEEVGLNSIGPFIDNTLNHAPPMRNVETDLLSDLARPLGRGLSLLLGLLELLGFDVD